jgi:hypothetical protein
MFVELGASGVPVVAAVLGTYIAVANKIITMLTQIR